MTESESFWDLVDGLYWRREVDALERAALAVERGNKTLADLPPEGEWHS